MMIAPDKSITIGQYTMAGEFFTKGFPAGGGPCTCSGACCDGGVFADLRERDVIMAHRELIARQMDETQLKDSSSWFEAEVSEDDDFPSGKCIGTQVINNKCAFLDKRGRCSIQSAALAAGMHKWALKPLFCILYPIDISDSIVSFDEMLQDEQTCCSIGRLFEVPLFEGCGEELVHLVGQDGFAAMREHYATLQRTGAAR